MNLDKIIDSLMFRQPVREDSDTDKPQVTTGSIILGLILRSLIIIILSVILFQYTATYKYWWIALLALWLIAVYPAYRQYQSYNRRIEEFQEATLCGTCRHFEPTSQLCRLYDLHVSSNYIPCEGESWEPKSTDI